MPRRVQVNPNQPVAGLEPVAAPRSLPFVPRLGPETILPVKELAGLSNVLAGIAIEQAKKDTEDERVRDYMLDQAAPAGPEAVAAATQDQGAAERAVLANQQEYTAAVQSGEIHVAQDPHVHTGHVQSSAVRLMRGYDAKLQAAMSQATMTNDPATGDPVMPKDPEQVIAEVWKQYQDEPFLKNRYGARIAMQMKGASDARFVEQASKEAGENKVKDTIHSQVNDLSDKLFGQAVSGEPPTAEFFANIRKWQGELYHATGGVAKPGKVMMAAAKSLEARMSDADDGEGGVSPAAQALRALRDAPNGSTTLGKDAETGPELEDLIAAAERAHKEKQGNAASALRDARNAAVLKAEQEVYAKIDKARESGAPVDILAIVDKYSKDIRPESGSPLANQFGNLTGVVADAVQKLALDSTQQQGLFDGSQFMQALDDGDDPDAVAYAIRMSRRQLGPDMSRKLLQEVSDRKSIQSLIEKSPTSNQWDKTIAASNDVPGIPQELRGEIGVEVQAKNRSLISDFNSRRVTEMKRIQALPEEQREEAQRLWGEKNVKELTDALDKNGLDFAANRTKARTDIQKLIDTNQDAGAAIESNLQYLSTDEAARAHALSNAGQNYQTLLATPEAQRGLGLVLESLEGKYAKDEDKPFLLESATRVYNDLYTGSVGEALAGSDPAKKASILTRVAREVTDQVLIEVEAKRLARFNRAVQPGGETLPAAKAQLDFAAQDRATANTLLKIDDPAKRAKALTTANPNVPAVVADYQSAYLRGASSFGLNAGPTALALVTGGVFSRVTRADVDARAEVEMRKFIDDPQRTPQEKAQAVVDAYKATGYNAEDLLRGKVAVRATPEWRARAEKEYRFLHGLVGERAQTNAAIVRKALDAPPPEVSLEGVLVPIYTTPIFETQAELELWVNTRKADLETIFHNNGVLDGDAAFEEVVQYQIQAINKRPKE